MNKKLLAAFTAVSLLMPVTAHAALKNQTDSQQAPTLVVLDTALDANLFPGKIAYEVCILDWNTCPNGKNYMEGPGSAYLPTKFITQNGFDHGTQMTSIAIANNPNIKIIFIRVIGATLSGARQLTYESTVYKALDWVIANKDRFNIQAVSMSQGRHDFATTSNVNYCLNTPTTQNKIKTLVAIGVPSFFPTGNGRDYQRIDWPGCIDDSIAVAATDQYDEIAIYGNYDPLKTDIFALGVSKATVPGNFTTTVAGTSVAVQVAAAQWIAVKQSHPTYTYSQINDLIMRTAKNTFNSKITSGKLINMEAAINGK